MSGRGQNLSNTGISRSKSAAMAWVTFWFMLFLWFVIEGLFNFDIWIWALPWLRRRSIKQWLVGGGLLLISILIAGIWVGRPSDSKVEIVQN